MATLDHETCCERLLDLRYGELAPREAAEVERHLEGCAGCRAERDRLEATLDAMANLDVPPAPDRGEAVLLAAARAAAGERKRETFGAALRRFGLRVAMGTAFAAGAVFLVLRSAGDRVAFSPAPAPQDDMVAPFDAPAPAPAPAAVPALEAAPEAARPGPASPRPEPPRLRAAAPPPAAQRPARRTKAGEARPAPAGPEASAVRSEQAWEAEALQRDQAAAPDVLPHGAVQPKARGLAMTQGAPAAGAEPRAAAAGMPALGELARDVERRHGAGELSELRKRYPACPGGDVRRTGWIDGAQRVRKLVRDRSDGARIEEWFDEEGRLREALARRGGAGAGWSHHLVVDPDGAERVEVGSSSGLAPGITADVPAPSWVRRDPSIALFGGPGCEPAGR